jgi:hypothetical protein
VTATTSAVSGAWSAVARWWTQPVARGRIAWLRTFLYLFVVVDIVVWVNDVVPHGYTPELYRPLAIGRLLPLPVPSPPLVHTLQVVLVVGCLVGATGRLPRLAGWVVAVAFLEWLVLGMSFGKVDHDHLALLVAVWVLPTAGAARHRDRTPTEAAGWAVRCIQVAVVATYFLSAISKSIRSGWPWGWANGAVFTWAISRRGSDLGRLLLDYPWLLRIGQWTIILAELCSPVILFLRGRALALAAAFWLSFHLVTWLMIGIHFLPTVVCWLAFAPLERLLPARGEPAGDGSAGAPRARALVGR